MHPPIMHTALVTTLKIPVFFKPAAPRSETVPAHKRYRGMPDSVPGVGSKHDLLQDRIVKGEGHVCGVEGDEAFDEVRVRVRV